MDSWYDEIEIEDFEYDDASGCYYYPCPCGDRFQITKEEILEGESFARCPSCSLYIKVIGSNNFLNFSVNMIEKPTILSAE